MGTPDNSSLLNQGNAAFRAQDYEQALHCYQRALRQVPEALRPSLEFNIELTRRRLGTRLGIEACKNEGRQPRPDAPERAVASSQAAAPLEKPASLDDYFFNLIKESGLFDPDWYLVQYGAKYEISGNPLAHYLEHGVAFGTNPSPGFDTTYYVKANPDVAACGLHPFLHYLCQGHKEGRRPKPPLSDDDLEIYPVEEARYVPRLPPDAPPVEKAVRVIAFYLPQFHPIPENDKWWGEGFTEWTNVRPAQPQFEGHYQPHVPDDFLGYYDLRDTSVMRKQIELAKQYGIEGFCFYVYWFGGKRLLEKPVDNYLADPSLDLPFCICWANENWTRRWDGLDHEVLMKQEYSPESDLEFIKDIAKYMRDPRYIRISGKPLFLVYRPSLLPAPKETARLWRKWCRANGIGEIYLAYTQSFEAVDPANYDFDAAIEFPPNNTAPPNITDRVTPIVKDFAATVYDWRALVERSKNYNHPEYKLFRCANPSWDNTARRKNKGSILLYSSPWRYQEWLYNAIIDTRKRFRNPDERLIFINAWNEWAEGAHLEPDKRHGFGYLEATRVAHVRCNIVFAQAFGENENGLAILIHAYYPDVFEELLERLPDSLKARGKLFISTIEEHAEIIRAIAAQYAIPYEIFVFENRGRDVLPFIKMMPTVVDQGFDYLLKLHTKKSLHREDGDRWRNDLYRKLLDERLGESLMPYLRAHPEVGLIAPDSYVAPLYHYWGSNKKKVESIGRRLGIYNIDIENYRFIAGTMFYARTRALQPLLHLAISDEDFEPESGQVDGTLAHAIERAIALSALAAGMKIAVASDVLGFHGITSQSIEETLDLGHFYKPVSDGVKLI